MFLKFKEFIKEAWSNRIEKSSKEASVTSSQKYNHPTDFKKNAVHIGNVNGLQLHSSETSGGKTHFTWNPEDKQIHHVVHAAQSNGKQLKFLSAHSREGSPVKMDHVYASLIKDHGHEMVGTSHSVGAQKLWKKLETHHGISIHGHDPKTGITRKLSDSEPRYADMKDKNSSIGKMHLIAKK